MITIDMVKHHNMTTDGQTEEKSTRIQYVVDLLRRCFILYVCGYDTKY